MKSKNTLIMTVGLPKSGKTSWALEQGYPVVNTQAVLNVLFEKLSASGVAHIRYFQPNLLVNSLFKAGHRVVILDDCNLTKKGREKWYSPDDWTRHFALFYEATKEDCVKRSRGVGEEGTASKILRLDGEREDIREDELKEGESFSVIRELSVWLDYHRPRVHARS